MRCRSYRQGVTPCRGAAQVDRQSNNTFKVPGCSLWVQNECVNLKAGIALPRRDQGRDCLSIGSHGGKSGDFEGEPFFGFGMRV
jgi:hypothetical protein